MQYIKPTDPNTGNPTLLAPTSVAVLHPYVCVTNSAGAASDVMCVNVSAPSTSTAPVGSSAAFCRTPSALSIGSTQLFAYFDAYARNVFLSSIKVDAGKVPTQFVKQAVTADIVGAHLHPADALVGDRLLLVVNTSSTAPGYVAMASSFKPVPSLDAVSLMLGQPFHGPVYASCQDRVKHCVYVITHVENQGLTMRCQTYSTLEWGCPFSSHVLLGPLLQPGAVPTSCAVVDGPSIAVASSVGGSSRVDIVNIASKPPTAAPVVEHLPSAAVHVAAR